MFRKLVSYRIFMQTLRDKIAIDKITINPRIFLSDSKSVVKNNGQMTKYER